MKFPFCGSSYRYRSIAFDAQRAINLYPAKSESGSSKDSFIMCPTPGRRLFTILPFAPIRGVYKTATRAFAVAANTLYELFSDGSYIMRGTLNTFVNNVSMSDNGTQLIIVDGTPTGGWILDLDTNAYQQITDPGFEGAVTVRFLSPYFIINRPGTGIYQISDEYDGLLWDPTEFANAEGSPDNLVAIEVVHQQAFLLGGDTIQVVYNSGASPFPLDTVQGVFIEYGIVAPFAVEQCANTIFWVGNDKSGANVVWMADGYQPKRISTEAIEYYLSRYEVTTATSYSYQEDGHYFYVINIAGSPSSLVYDITMEQWHERAFWNVNSGQYERDRANGHIYAFGKHLVPDFENGNIYDQSLNYNDDNGTLIRRRRTMPYFVDDLEYMYFKWLQIDMQVGVGLNDDTDYEGQVQAYVTENGIPYVTEDFIQYVTEGDIIVPADPQNTDPMIILRYSDDGGNTWSNERVCSIGKIGQYRVRARWNRLGRSRFRIYEVTTIANVPIFMIAAHQEVDKGNA